MNFYPEGPYKVTRDMSREYNITWCWLPNARLTKKYEYSRVLDDGIVLGRFYAKDECTAHKVIIHLSRTSSMCNDYRFISGGRNSP